LKIVSIVGARPQFVKAAALSRAIRREHHEVIVHTGQHYDAQLSDVFFDELGLARPDHHLGVGSGPHGWQTGLALQRIEPVLERERPGWVLVFGDTNSTLAGALAAAKLRLPLAHVEAGLRSFNRAMPEEINRIVADHCADLLFCPTRTAVDHLTNEGLGERARLTGDVMYDSLLQHAELSEGRSAIMERLGLERGGYLLVTVHRPSNTDDQPALERILDALAALDLPVVFPMHPRAKLALASGDLETPANVRAIEPVGYLEMLALEQHAAVVLTDSGGVQKEAYLLSVPCVTLREETEWPETLEGGWNVLAGNDSRRIVDAARRPRPDTAPAPAFGDGHAAERIVELLSSEQRPPQRRCLA
jgi:UDP-N-acetylglucosamine 2-epimerase